MSRYKIVLTVDNIRLDIDVQGSLEHVVDRIREFCTRPGKLLTVEIIEEPTRE